MPVPPLIESSYTHLMDFCFGNWPQPKPGRTALRGCRIVAHRGQHDNRSILENTLPAFEKAVRAGVWGIELDVRWTRDRVPVVHHDDTLERLFNVDLPIDRLAWPELRARVPQVPALAEVVNQFGGRVHLMVEIKSESGSDALGRQEILSDLLAPLAPKKDFHLMSLDPALLVPFKKFPRDCLVAIAGQWPDGRSRWVLEHKWGGLCSHFSLLRGSLVKRHHDHGQRVGSGYATTSNTLFREINRGVDWIFTNHALELQSFLDRCLHSD